MTYSLTFWAPTPVLRCERHRVRPAPTHCARMVVRCNRDALCLDAKHAQRTPGRYDRPASAQRAFATRALSSADAELAGKARNGSVRNQRIRRRSACGTCTAMYSFGLRSSGAQPQYTGLIQDSLGRSNISACIAHKHGALNLLCVEGWHRPQNISWTDPF